MASIVFSITSCWAVFGRKIEPVVMPGHEFFDKPVVYSAISFQYGQHLGAEDLFQFFKLCLGEAIEGPVRSKEPVCDDSVKMGMKPGVIPEGVDHHDHPRTPSSKPDTEDWVGGDLLCHAVARAVPLGLRSLTTVFGMGTGVASSLLPPAQVSVNK